MSSGQDEGVEPENAMNIAATLLVIAVASHPGSTTLDQNYNSPDWRGYMRRGLMPYHKLVANDFRLVDRAEGDLVAYTTGFIQYSCEVQVSNRDPFRARVVRLTVWSGLDRNLTWRKRNVPVTESC